MVEVISHTIQPFPSSEIDDAALKALRMDIADMPLPVRPMDAQVASFRGEEGAVGPRLASAAGEPVTAHPHHPSEES